MYKHQVFAHRLINAESSEREKIVGGIFKLIDGASPEYRSSFAKDLMATMRYLKRRHLVSRTKCETICHKIKNVVEKEYSSEGVP